MYCRVSLHIYFQPQLVCCLFHRFDFGIGFLQRLIVAHLHFEINSQFQSLEIHPSSWADEGAEDVGPILQGNCASNGDPFDWTG